MNTIKSMINPMIIIKSRALKIFEKERKTLKECSSGGGGTKRKSEMNLDSK